MNTYLVKVIKTQYFYVEVKAKDEDEAEIKAVELPEDEINSWYDDEEWESIALERIKTPLEGTI
jgi:predicted alpha-1,6-mannanase (GH76 family)